MKKNKNGFVFVETIVVCAVLAVSLVTIYSSFILIVNNQKRRNNYDQTVYNYRAYNVVKALDDSVLEKCTSIRSLNNSNDNVINLRNYFQIKNIYQVPGWEIDDFTTDAYLLDYAKTIETNASECIYVFEFENPQKTNNNASRNFYSHIVVEG